MNSVSNIPYVHVELIDLILKNLTPMESKVVRATCKTWNALISENFENFYTKQALHGKLDLPNLVCVTYTLIAKSSTDYPLLLQLCNQAGAISQTTPPRDTVSRIKSSTQIILGISTEMQQGFEKTDLTSVDVPEHIVSLAGTHPFATFMAGLVEYSKTKQLAKLSEASEKGVPSATFLLHLRQRSEEILIKAAEQGSSAACLLLAEENENKDENKRLKYLQSAAELGDKIAQYHFGLECLNEKPKEAMMWLERSALRGTAAAQVLIGELFEAGDSEAGAVIARLKQEGIPSAHLENGRFFQKYKTLFTSEEGQKIKNYKDISPINSEECLKEIEAIKELVLKRYQETLEK